MVRPYAIALALCAVGLLLTGCGSSGGTKTSATTTTAIQPEDTARDGTYWGSLNGVQRKQIVTFCKAQAATAAGDAFSEAYRRIQAVNDQDLAAALDTYYLSDQSKAKPISEVCASAAPKSVSKVTVNLPGFSTSPAGEEFADIAVKRTPFTIRGDVDPHEDTTVVLASRNNGGGWGRRRTLRVNSDGHFSAKVHLAPGENDYRIRASAPSYKTGTSLLAITLKRSPQQIAEDKARQRAAKARQLERERDTVPGDGTFLVGTDINPGVYRAAASPGCYWARLSSLDTNDIIDNDNADGPVVLQVLASDKALKVSGCSTFHKAG